MIQGSQRLTYSELDQQANQAAHYLRKRGVGPEVLVGLCMEQSLRAIVGVLGILKAGGAYVPLDAVGPVDRLTDVVRDAQLSLIVTSARYRERIPVDTESVCLDRDAALIAAESIATPHSTAVPDNAVYVLYTSGSTGGPKGVVGIHRSITNGLNSVSYAPDEVCCLNTSLLFGFSLANLFLPLICGIPLVVLSDPQIKDIHKMITVLESEAVTRMVLTPAVFKQMLSLGPRTVSKLGKIRTVRVAGSELTPDILKSFRELMPQAKIQNGYSSTEIGTVAALWEAQEESTVPVEISIGRPVANTHIYVLDRHRNRVPVGTAGDIYVGARHLARGYLNRPDLTADRFVPDPFSIEPGSRMYFTGDLGRFQSNGNLQFMGRADDQVKIRGFRIELAEVEQALASHAGVREAAAAAKTIGGDQRLIAYVVVNEMGAPSPNQMRNHLRKSLPDHMIPSAFVFMDRLPLGGNGKVDRRLLPLPAPVRPKLDSEYVEPRDELELAVARVWSDLLGLAPIGVHDDFRELGGDSLLAAQVASRIGDLSGLEMDQESLFERPTIAELADYIRSHSGTAEPRRNSVGDAARASASGFFSQKEEFQTGAERTVIPDAFKVVVNLEEQYSLLPATLPVPQGWREAAIYGTKRDCLDAIARIWKDLRPLSVRRHLQSGGWSVT